MNAKCISAAIAALALAFPAILFGQSNSSSASYQLLSNAPGGGGGQIGNGSTITALVSIGGGIGGAVSNTTVGGVQLKPNYIGQLYDVTAVLLDASPSTVDEGGTRQLGAAALLDDLTWLLLSPGDVAWTVGSGPLTGIDAAGLATGDVVFEDTAATAEGSFSGVSGQLGLTVLNTDPDNFGGYAGDGLEDGWQVSFFGLPPNADAGPGMNPDNDPYDNYFEFLTGFDPNDPSDFFRFSIVDRTGSDATLELSKIIPGTRYSVWRSVDLNQADAWRSFTDFTTGVEVLDHPVTDMNATGSIQHYRIGVEPE